MTTLGNPLLQPRLSLPPPDGAAWQIRMIGQNLQEADIAPGVLLRMRALVVPTVEYTEWVDGIMLEDAPAGTKLVPISVAPTTSRDGLPVVLAHHELHDPQGRTFETRIGAFYAIVQNRAEVVVRLRGDASWAAHQDELLPYLLSGTVCWPEYEDDLLITQLGITP